MFKGLRFYVVLFFGLIPCFSSFATLGDSTEQKYQVQSETFLGLMKQFGDSIDNPFQDSPFYDDVIPASPDYYEPDVPKSIAHYYKLMKQSKFTNYLLFGGNQPFTQIVFRPNKVTAVQIVCAMHCRPTNEPNKMIKVRAVQDGKRVWLMNHGKAGTAVIDTSKPYRLEVNLGNNAVYPNVWQHLEIDTNKNSANYWRAAKQLSADEEGKELEAKKVADAKDAKQRAAKEAEELAKAKEKGEKQASVEPQAQIAVPKLLQDLHAKIESDSKPKTEVKTASKKPTSLIEKIRAARAHHAQARRLEKEKLRAEQLAAAERAQQLRDYNQAQRRLSRNKSQVKLKEITKVQSEPQVKNEQKLVKNNLANEEVRIARHNKEQQRVDEVMQAVKNDIEVKHAENKSIWERLVAAKQRIQKSEPKQVAVNTKPKAVTFKQPAVAKAATMSEDVVITQPKLAEVKAKHEVVATTESKLAEVKQNPKHDLPPKQDLAQLDQDNQISFPALLQQDNLTKFRKSEKKILAKQKKQAEELHIAMQKKMIRDYAESKKAKLREQAKIAKQQSVQAPLAPKSTLGARNADNATKQHYRMLAEAKAQALRENAEKQRQAIREYYERKKQLARQNAAPINSRFGQVQTNTKVAEAKPANTPKLTASNDKVSEQIQAIRAYAEYQKKLAREKALPLNSRFGQIKVKRNAEQAKLLAKNKVTTKQKVLASNQQIAKPKLDTPELLAKLMQENRNKRLEKQKSEKELQVARLDVKKKLVRSDSNQ